MASSSADVGDEAPPAGLRLGGTHLTGVAPGPSNGGTAQSLCADNACQLPLAHLVVDLSETWACPVIWNVKEDRKTGFMITHQSYTRTSKYIKQRLFWWKHRTTKGQCVWFWKFLIFQYWEVHYKNSMYSTLDTVNRWLKGCVWDTDVFSWPPNVLKEFKWVANIFKWGNFTWNLYFWLFLKSWKF